MKFLYLFLIILFSYSCQTSSTIGDETQPCYTNNTCNLGLVCLNNVCIKDRCKSVSCESWESCEPISGKCEIEPGKCGVTEDCKNEKVCKENICIDKRCEDITCSNHGKCSIKNDEVTCICDEGFNNEITPLICNNDLCTLECSNHGNCIMDNETPTCSCEEHYKGDDCSECTNDYILKMGVCVLKSSICESVDCGHGVCELDGNEPICNCDTLYTGDYCMECVAGYILEEGSCILDLSICEGVDCGHGECKVEGGEAVCDCETNYTGLICGECVDGYHLKDGECVSIVTDQTLIISEYIEGTADSKALELYNPTDRIINLSKYKLWKIINGGEWKEAELSLTGTLNANETYVIVRDHTDSSQIIKDKADLLVTSDFMQFNGDDAIALVEDKDNNGVWTTEEIIDLIGKSGDDPGNSWPIAGVGQSAPATTRDHVLIRKPSIIKGNTDWDLSAGTTPENSEWLYYAPNYFDNLGIR